MTISVTVTVTVRGVTYTIPVRSVAVSVGNVTCWWVSWTVVVRAVVGSSVMRCWTMRVSTVTVGWWPVSTWVEVDWHLTGCLH